METFNISGNLRVRSSPQDRNNGIPDKFIFQTPHSQSNLINFNEYPEYLSAGGGFGPVSEVGYGVSYIVCHEDLIMFHVSSSSIKGSPEEISDLPYELPLLINPYCQFSRK